MKNLYKKCFKSALFKGKFNKNPIKMNIFTSITEITMFENK